LFLPGKIGKGLERVFPHGFEVGAEVVEALGIETEVVPRAAPFFFDQSDIFEDAEMLGHSGAADRETAGEIAYGGGLASKQVEDGLAGRIGKRGKSDLWVSHTLR